MAKEDDWRQHGDQHRLELDTYLGHITTSSFSLHMFISKDSVENISECRSKVAGLLRVAGGGAGSTHLERVDITLNRGGGENGKSK